LSSTCFVPGGQAEFAENGGDVLVLELNGAMRPADLCHQDFAMPGLDVLAAGQLGFQHFEVVAHNGVELVVPPLFWEAWAGAVNVRSVPVLPVLPP
jgi:hypothetical protein